MPHSAQGANDTSTETGDVRQLQSQDWALPRHRSMVMLAHEALARAFVEEGTRLVFNVMGDGNKNWLVDVAASPGARLCNVRHEGAGLAMADGFARASDDVGVCSVTYGPGVTQLPTSLMVAQKHNTPIVVFAGDITDAERDSGSHLDFDGRRLLEASGGDVFEVRDPNSSATMVHRAFHRARQASRPTVVLASLSVQKSVVASAPSKATTPSIAEARDRPRFQPADAELREACEVITRWRRPIVLAGRGALLSGAGELASKVAARLGALTSTTFLGKGLFDGEPFDLGLAGGFTFADRRAIFAAADGVLAVGARLTAHTTDHGQLFPDAEIVTVDIEERDVPEVGEHVRAQLIGDARCTLQAMLDQIGKGASRFGEWRTDEVEAALRDDSRLREIDELPADDNDPLIDPRRLMLGLDELLPNNADVVIGGGHSMAFSMRYLRKAAARRFFPVFDFMTVGQGLPAAIGAAMSGGDRPVIGMEGDASFLMQVQELETAARYQVPLLFFVLNDEALGAEYHLLLESGLDPSEAIVPTPDLAGVASALGARARRLNNIAELPAVLSWYEPDAGPQVVDCRISREVRAPI